MTATGLVLGSRYVVSARDAGNVITACVQNGNGNLRFSSSGGCKGGETPLQWNTQGPQGPMGPMGPAGPAGTTAPTNGPTASSGLRIVDSQGTTVGDWQSPSYVSLTINSEIVFVGLDLAARTFLTDAPAFFYTDNNCQTAPMMFLDMTHFGSVQGGVLSYPTGGVISTTFASFSSGGACQPSTGGGTFGAVATANVSSFVAPFSLK